MGIYELLFPSKCPICGNIVSKDEADEVSNICGDCLLRVHFFPKGGNGCEKGLSCIPSADKVYCYFKYSGRAKEAVRDFKFKGQVWIGESLSAGFAGMLEEENAFEDIICITYVPLSDERLRERGFNQSEILANKLSEISGRPVIPLITRKKQGIRASEANLQERKESEGKFDFNENYRTYIENRGVLLADDILTTGSTLEECSAGLRRAGAGKVCCAVLATGRRDV